MKKAKNLSLCNKAKTFWLIVLAIVVGLFLVTNFSYFAKIGKQGKTDTTTACRYDVGIGGDSSIAAGNTGTFDVSVYPVSCSIEGDTAISLFQNTAPAGASIMPTCTVDVGSLHLLTSGVAKAKISCVTTSGTTAGYYKYYANFSQVNGVTPISTWFTFSVTAPAATCPTLNFKLAETKTSYVVGDMVNYSYICADGTNTSSVSIVLHKPDNTDTTYVTGTNVGSTLQQMGFSTSNLAAGSYTLKAVLSNGTTYPLPFTVTAATSTTTASPTLMGTIFKDGQYVDPATNTVRNCVSPSYWMKEGSTTSGARSFHCMPNTGGNTQSSNDIPPSPCTGTLWAGYSGGSSTTAVAPDYCAVTNTSTGTTTTNTCPSGWSWNGTSCVNSTTTTTTTTTSPTACANGTKCPSTSWCQNGQQFYYPDGQLTCVAWSNDGIQPVAPTGTSACRPSEPNCVDIGQTVPYVSGKWCTRGQSYYSTTQMTCVAMGSTAPTGFSSCKPGDSTCIPSGSYGPSTGYCSNGMQFYQKVKDADPNNDKYCAEMKYTAGTAATAAPMQTPEPPAGYGACDPTNTGCKEKGDKWTDNNSSNWCSNSQKCTFGTGGGTCVGWNESCPSGTKYCSVTDTNCIEPGEYKTITASTTNSTNSYWCGGGGGMSFYSATQAYCEPKKAGSATMMWSSADIKAILAKLGAGWGVCPKGGTTNGASQCIEPGTTGPSNGWCGWWPPNAMTSYSPSNGGNSGTRTCPGFDDGTPTPTPIPVKEICPPSPSVSSCPIGQHIEKSPGTVNCPGSTYCKEDLKKPPFCPAIAAVPCKEGQTYENRVSENGCNVPYCVDIKNQPPTVQTPVPLPIYPQYDNCRMAKDQARGYKYEIKQLDQSLKYFPKDITIPADLSSLLKSAQAAYDAIDKLFPLGTKVICTDDFYQSVQAQVTALNTLMNGLREKAGNVQAYMQCSKFQKDIDQRVKMLEQDAKRMNKTKVSIDDELAAMKALSAKVPEVCKAADQFTMQDLNYERQDIEDRISEKFNQSATTARDSFVDDTVDNILFGIGDARQQIKDKNLSDKEECQKVENLFTQVESLAGSAKTAYDSGNTEDAGATLDKIFRFKEPVTIAASQCGIKLDMNEGQVSTDVYSNVNSVSDEAIKSIVDKAVEKFSKEITDRFTAVLDEKIKQFTARVAQIQVSEQTQNQIQTSVNALQAVPKDVRTATEEAKNSTIDTLASIDQGKAKIKADLYARVRASLEHAATLNLFGAAADAIKAQTAALKLHADNGDVTIEDVTALEQTLAAAEKQNSEECYKTGGCRFHDTDPSSWYYGYLQNSTTFKGDSDGNGNFTGNVGPGRQTLRAEALMAIERAAGIPGIEGTCELTATGVKGVPSWANCAVNSAVDHRLVFNGSLSEPASRDEVASWMVAFEKDHLPVRGAANFTNGFRDIGSCRDAGAVSYIVANKIMNGYGGDRAGTWGCGQPLLRAELAAILSRLTDLLSLTRSAVID
ncbi:hypothetical protein HZA40_00520 [Candidatus Peregrinibacteria bacterium]|nr:hypothetical protein [Candidatus Peregrinibacteria bacterium]